MDYRLFWIGGNPEIETAGEGWSYITFHTNTNNLSFEVEQNVADWFSRIFSTLLFESNTITTLKMLGADYESVLDGNFEEFLYSDLWVQLRAEGLLLIRYKLIGKTSKQHEV